MHASLTFSEVAAMRMWWVFIGLAWPSVSLDKQYTYVARASCTVRRVYNYYNIVSASIRARIRVKVSLWIQHSTSRVMLSCSTTHSLFNHNISCNIYKNRCNFGKKRTEVNREFTTCFPPGSCQNCWNKFWIKFNVCKQMLELKVLIGYLITLIEIPVVYFTAQTYDHCWNELKW